MASRTLESESSTRISHASATSIQEVYKATEFSGLGQPEAHEGCPPSSSSLRESVAKVSTHSALTGNLYVPVVDQNQKPLMPTSPKRAHKLIKSWKATPFWKRGIFCIRLNQEPSSRIFQPIAVGIDPGSKKEGLTVKSRAHTFLNIQADAVTWVKEAVETRRTMRRGRRSRKTPCRQNRMNRSRGSLPPSTKARWQWKLRLVSWLTKMFPITAFVVEDIKAVSKKGQRKWNSSFSPLEVGKKWFYDELKKLGDVTIRQGIETCILRFFYGLSKTKKKLAEVFSAHCVDSWVLSNDLVGGHEKPDNERLLCVVPLQFHRRMLHRMKPSKGGVRALYGGTRSMDLKRGTLVKHPKFGLTYVGGASSGKLSLHSLETGKRLNNSVKREDIRVLSFNSWRSY